MKPLAGRTALVTGAGRGVGAAIAEKLASAGAAVVLNDVDTYALTQIVSGIIATGEAAVACPGDVCDPLFAQRFIDTAMRAFGTIDIIVNNAGYTWDAVIQNMTDEQWDRVLDVHMTAPFRILRAAQPVISAAARREQGSVEQVTRKVVNISSLAGLYGNAGQSNYAAAKAGILGLTKTLAKEWGRYRVTVNAVSLGVIATRLTQPVSTEAIEIGEQSIPVGINPAILQAVTQSAPLSRIGTPIEAAGAVYLLCIPESDYITGEVLACSGGLVA